MKNLIFTVVALFLFSISLFAQPSAGHVSMDLKNTEGIVKSIVPIKGKGVVVVIINKKPLGIDLVFYDMAMEKKWTCSFSKEDLGMIIPFGYATSLALKTIRTDVVCYNDELVFLYNQSFMTANSQDVLTICNITLDGKVKQKTKAPGSDYDDIVTIDNEPYIYVPGVGDNPSYYLKDIFNLNANKGIELHVPALKSGRWAFAGHADGKLYFYGIQEAKNKENKENGFEVYLVPLSESGEMEHPITLTVKLNEFFPSSESMDSPPLFLKLDTVTQGFYIYCNMAKNISYGWSTTNSSTGVFIQKYDYDGTLKWAKQYSNKELTALNKDASCIGSYISSLSIDDSTHNIILVRRDLSEMGEAVPSKCYEFDAEGNLRKAFKGFDESDYTNPVSPFYSSVTYQDGDPKYYQKINDIYAQYPAGKKRPSCNVINAGGKLWLIISSRDRYTLDIYEL